MVDEDPSEENVQKMLNAAKEDLLVKKSGW